MKHLLLFFMISVFLSCSLGQRKTEIVKTGKFYPEVEQRSVIFGQIENIHDFKNAPREIKLSVDEISINHQ